MPLFAAAALVALGDAAANGDVSLRDTAFVLQAGVIVVRVGAFFMEADLGTEFGMSAYQALESFEEKAAGRYSAVGSGSRSADGLPRESIRFEQVSFAYPGSERAVLDGLDLEIPAGGSLAIVGLNGAGKTTLIKLLARLLRADVGADHRRRRSTCASSTSRAGGSRIAAIFQDFVHYELPVADNIGLGVVSHLGDEAAIRRAAQRAGALEVIDALPDGLATPLSARYSGGVDVSGGQWQRIALARALFALEQGTSVLVLDEPTANLDVRAEAELFDRFIEIDRRRDDDPHLAPLLDACGGPTGSSCSTTERSSSREATTSSSRARGRYEELFRLQAARFALDEVGSSAGGEP